MKLTLCPLFSSSAGNSIYISCGGVKVLVDAGVSASRIQGELEAIGVDIRDIDAILVTHEHVDHVKGIGVLCRRYRIPVYATEGTWNGILQKECGIPESCRMIVDVGCDFNIGRLFVRPFPIPHDAMEPCGYRFDCGELSCAVATDIGQICADWLEAVAGCQALVLEANHDVTMVQNGPYPQRLKQRVLGKRGHLCNTDCAKALVQLAGQGAQAVFLSHLSADNNLPELAYNTVCEALADAGYAVGDDIRVMVSRRDRVSDLLVLG